MKAADNRIPLGLNRWVYLGILCVYILFSGPTVMNWPPLRKMLVGSGAYAWKCNPYDEFDDQMTCSEQRKAITLCGNLGQTMMFVGSSFAGLVADTFGPKIVSFVGGIFFTISYIMLAVSSQKAQLYIPCYVLNGIAIEFCFFGLLTVPNCFPKRRQLSLTILGSARSLSMLYSMMQYAMFDPESFKLHAVGWVCTGLSVIFTVSGWILIPWKPFTPIKSDGEEEARMLEQEVSPAEQSKDLEIVQRSETPLENGEYRARAENVEEAGALVVDRELESIKLRYFIKKLLGWGYVIWLLIFAISYCRGQFYGLSVDDQSSEIVSKAFSILSPLSFIPCPVFGYIADKYGMTVVLLILNAIGTVMYIGLISGTGGIHARPSVAGAWIAVFGSHFFLSFLASQNYCWIQENYNYIVQGRLAGIAMCFVGLISLVNTPFYNFASDQNKFKVINVVYLSLSFVNFGLLYVLWMLKGTLYDDPETVLAVPTEEKQTPSTVDVLTAHKEV